MNAPVAVRRGDGNLVESVRFVFQPVIEMSSGDVAGFEMLARRALPDGTTVMPDNFLPDVFDGGLADDLTLISLRAASNAIAALRRRHGSHVRVAVNLSNAQINSSLLAAVDLVLDGATETDWLTIEVVEDIAEDRLGELAEIVEQLRHRRVQILLDDFGTGTANLAVLHSIGFDGIKLDQRFVDRISHSDQARRFVAGVIAFGHQAGVSIVAEGVEDVARANELRVLNCAYAQGYHFGRPTRLEDLDLAVRARPNINDSDAPAEIRQLVKEMRGYHPMEAGGDLSTICGHLDTLTARLDAFDNSPDWDELRAELDYKRLLAAMYTGDIDAAVQLGTDLERTAERLGLPAMQGRTLTVLASAVIYDHNKEPVATDALTRALRVRRVANLSHDEKAQMDNNLGAVFSHLGLVSEAIEWWSRGLNANGLKPTMHGEILAVNLAEEILGSHEGSLAQRTTAISGSSMRVADHAIARLEHAVYLPRSIAATLRARQALARGDLRSAQAYLAHVDSDDLSGFLGSYHVLRAFALVAMASEDHQTAVELAERSVAELELHPLIRVYQRRADRLLAEAYTRSGRSDDACFVLNRIVANDSSDRVASTETRYIWLEAKLDETRRFANR